MNKISLRNSSKQASRLECGGKVTHPYDTIWVENGKTCQAIFDDKFQFNCLAEVNSIDEDKRRFATYLQQDTLNPLENP